MLVSESHFLSRGCYASAIDQTVSRGSEGVLRNYQELVVYSSENRVPVKLAIRVGVWVVAHYAVCKILSLVIQEWVVQAHHVSEFMDCCMGDSHALSWLIVG